LPQATRKVRARIKLKKVDPNWRTDILILPGFRFMGTIIHHRGPRVDSLLS
jgi:hypothetical protein